MQNSLLVVLLFFVVSVRAQQEQFEHSSSWNTVAVKADINEKWFVKSEFNFRRTNFFQDWEQFVLRPSIQYKVNPFITFGIGYTFIQNYSYSEFSVPIDNREDNLWQQLFIKQPFNALTLSHRLRFEERFQDRTYVIDGHYGITGSSYTNRLRYRFILEVPVFKKPKISVLVYDEVFLDFEKSFQPKKLDQNWIFFGLHFRKSEHISIKSGYHHINIPRQDHSITNHVWETTLIYSI